LCENLTIINNGYTVTGTAPYVINKGTGILPSVQTAIESIKTQSGGAACTIQFGDGTNTLDIDDGNFPLIIFNSDWTGLVTLTGKLTSPATTTTGIIRLINSASVDSKAELTATALGTCMIYNDGTGTITISDGKVSATAAASSTSNSTYAAYNNSTGTVIITGGTISTIGGSGYGYGLYNRATGTVTISGGEISTTGGTAVFNYINGTVTISGGTISSATGIAVYHYGENGKITVSGSAQITSANTSTSRCTIYLGNPYNVTTNVRLEITGGTISNTSTGADGNAIYNGSVSAITMNGGTVSTTATSGRAILNNTTGALTISAGTVTAPVNSTAYSINNSTGVVTVTSPPAVITGARYP
jgi:hypothetical protein